MAINEIFLLDAMLQYNYFPASNRYKDEMPPILHSEGLTSEVAKALMELDHRNHKSYPGYDAVEYRLTRSNSVSRKCSIPHPKAYVGLVDAICKNWNDIEFITGNPVNAITLEEHDDGRIWVFNYMNQSDEMHLNLDPSFGKRHVARTDISNFYPSFYSHSIPWALVGRDASKKRRKPDEWFNRIDKALMMTNRGETRGVAIGPVTSWIATEIVLTAADKILQEKLPTGVTYIRTLDDYVAYCDSETNAQTFLRELGQTLEEFQLELNPRKTSIGQLPVEPDSWINDLIVALPRRDEVTRKRIDGFIGLALKRSRQFTNQSESVLKYAVKAMSSVTEASDVLEGSDVEEVNDIVEPNDLDTTPRRSFIQNTHTLLRNMLNLAFHYPSLIPLLDKPFELEGKWTSLNEHSYEMRSLLSVNAHHKRTDAMTWLLYYCVKYGVTIVDSDANDVLDTRDCIPLMLLYKFGGFKVKNDVVSFAKSLDDDDYYLIDRYWLLLYQLYIDGAIDMPVSQANVFDCLASFGVDFTRSVEKTEYEGFL